MKIVIDVKPYKYTGLTKQEVLNKALSDASFCFGSYGQYFKPLFNDKFAYVYTLEKHKQKFKQTKNSKGETTYKKIKEKQWILHLYKFETDLLKLAKIKLNQKTRTFTYLKTGN